MGSITRSFANNIGSSGTLVASAVTNATVEDVTAFGTAPSPATLVLISTQTASSSATISFTTGLDSTYDEYIFKFINIKPATDEVKLKFNLSTDAGSNYNVTKTSAMFFAGHTEADATGFGYDETTDLAQSTSDDFLTAGTVGNDADESCSGTLQLFNPSSTTYVKHYISSVTIYGSNPQSQISYHAGYGNTTSAVNAIIFRFESGNISDGIFKLYGVKKS